MPCSTVTREYQQTTASYLINWTGWDVICTPKSLNCPVKQSCFHCFNAGLEVSLLLVCMHATTRQCCSTCIPIHVNPRVALQCTLCVCVGVLYVQAYNGHFGVLEELLYKYQAYLDCKDEKGKCHFQLVHTHCQTMQLEL